MAESKRAIVTLFLRGVYNGAIIGGSWLARHGKKRLARVAMFAIGLTHAPHLTTAQHTCTWSRTDSDV